jgi:hypothetical protein
MERFTDEQVREIVRNKISVSRQSVALMKGLLLENFHPTTRRMIEKAVTATGCTQTDRLVLDGGEDSRKIDAAAQYFSWALCAIEAVWELVHSGLLLPASPNHMAALRVSIQIHRAFGSTVRHQSGIDILGGSELPHFPETVIRTRCDPKGVLLTDPDLYLTALRPHVAHVEVAEALQEAIRCFRSELFMASAVMLGKASEGVWIEIGKALLNALPKAQQSAYAKLRADLDSPNVGIAKKLRDLMKHYESKQAEYAVVAKSAGLSLDDVRLACLWSDMVRDSRNVVHYGTQPNLPNNYQNLATLLLTGSTHLRNLYALHASAIANPGK